MSETLAEISLRKAFAGRGYLVSNGGVYALIVIEKSRRHDAGGGVLLRLTSPQVQYVEANAKSPEHAVSLALEISNTKTIPDEHKQREERMVHEVTSAALKEVTDRLSALETLVLDLGQQVLAMKGEPKSGSRRRQAAG